ncbi:MAG: substrate-binding domain-containing protein [Oscillospiraceae bacterium]|nr:substrate-binding domain-containing protein [Oscillospiraceae bacterium]
MFNNDNDINKNPFSQNMQLFYATEQMSKQNQCSLIYATLDEKSNLDDLIKGNNIAGMLFVSYIPPHVLEQCVKAKIPAVCVNNRYTEIISIAPENERGSFEAVRYLQSKGHKKIAIILGKPNYYSTSERFRGYSAAMHLAAQNVDPRYVLEGDWSFDGAREAIFSMLDKVPRDELPTAIFCCSDAMAIGAMDALKERDFSIPNDISIMGFDNVQQSEQVYPRLSTVSVDIAQMAELVMEKLLSSNYDDIRKKGYIIQLPTELKLRQSVKEIRT